MPCFKTCWVTGRRDAESQLPRQRWFSWWCIIVQEPPYILGEFAGRIAEPGGMEVAGTQEAFRLTFFFCRRNSEIWGFLFRNVNEVART